MLRRSVPLQFYCGVDMIQKVHPDVCWGMMQKSYRGKGWIGYNRCVSIEAVTQQAGNGLNNLNDRIGKLHDPEDPRHPIATFQRDLAKTGLDGALNCMVEGDFGEIPKGTRLYQMLYDAYLEPWTVHRHFGTLQHHSKSPNWSASHLERTCYIGGTVSLVGEVAIADGTSMLEGTTVRGDRAPCYFGEANQIMENVCFMSDNPVTPHHYNRDEMELNPYQTFDVTEGVVKTGSNVMIEPNCLIEAVNIGSFTRVGHNSIMMKGSQTNMMNWILPGSVVLPDTNIPEGEIWGGAPARKVAKMSKFEYKKPWHSSLLHKQMVEYMFEEYSYFGDAFVYQMDARSKLNSLMIRYEQHLPDGCREKIREIDEGDEPFAHFVARASQGWSPAYKADAMYNDTMVPMIQVNLHRHHNDDAGTSEYIGGTFHIGKLHAEKLWW